MSSQISPQLSKSRFIAGLQCLKRLYLECYQRELADPLDPGQQALFDTGIAVGELATFAPKLISCLASPMNR